MLLYQGPFMLLCLQVMDSWRNVLSNIRPKAFTIDLEDVRIYASDNHAYVTCIEIINADENKGRCVSLVGLGVGTFLNFIS